MKVGVFGGSFDPLHNGHKVIINMAIELLNLDLMVLVPSFNPPHKSKSSASFNDRYAMLVEEFKDNKKIKVERIEEEMGLEYSYTYVVLDILKSFYGDDLYYIIGADSMIDFSTWKFPQIVASQATLVVIKRAGYFNLDEAIMFAKSQYNSNVIELDIKTDDISSSVLRGQLELFEPDAKKFIPKEAYRYIINNNLYSNYKEIIDKLKSNLSQKTFEHSKRTTLFALQYITKLKIPFHKAFLASLLHDCAKGIEGSIEDIEKLNTTKEVYHQFLGATLAKEIYEIDDEDILNAIKYHTTGRENMSSLEKLVYIADKLEPGRQYEGLDAIRQRLNENFNFAFNMLLKFNLEYLKSNKENIDSRTISTYLWYNQ
ncbi:MAG TPA: nicotinate (nicotinamide) nucleotide adenylyltransferase [Clostridiales bacterium]|nr:nicotinate (nicotinamide) nucleotide adenylyltransferase [Clostridiales bacterium]